MLKMRHFSPLFVLTLVCGNLLVGCNSSESPDWKDRVPFSGVVTLDGSPVEGATVLLQSTDTPPNAPATGLTDASGKFTLTTHTDNDGAIPGSYNISVKKVEFPASATASEDDPNYDPMAADAEPTYHVPQKYMSPANSGLSVAVSEAGEAEFKIELSAE